jgi:hypothetical protein
MEFHISTEIQNEPAQNQPATAVSHQKVHLDLVRDLTQLLGIRHQPGLNEDAEVDALSFGKNQPKCTGCGACRADATT